MFNLESITLSNFRSYHGEHTFKFPVTAGLYFLTGKNELEPALGSNGSGKSTFLEAITWCLYGRTTRGLKANEVLSWHADSGASVTLKLAVGDNTFKVKRTQKPNGLFIDGKPVDQKELETHLRLNYEAFTHSVLSPQFGTPFFSLLPSAKLTLFSDLNSLDFWLQKSDEADKLAKQQEKELTALTANINKAEGQIESIEADIVDLEIKEADFEAERENKIQELKLEISVTQISIDKLNKEIKTLQRLKKDIDLEIPLANDRLLEIEMQRHNVLKGMELLSQGRRDELRDLAECRERRAAFKNLKGYCNCCEQSVPTEHSKQVLRFIISKMTKLATSVENIDKLLKIRTESIAMIRLDASSRKRELDEVRSEQSDAEADMLKFKTKIGFLNESLDKIRTQLHEAKMGKNPFGLLLESKKNNLGTIRSKRSNDTKNRECLEIQHAATSFWVKGFKRVRLFIIEQAFQTLEVEVNNSLVQLGMVDWEVTFDVERENKSGGITKGFIVLIKSPSNKEPVRWENWSGGETQRLQLAGDLGLANLIMQQAGLDSRVEFYDEPSTHLSSEGMTDLANMLHERAVNEGKCIWIVDHTSITNFGELEGVITAVKNRNGSSITCNW